MQDIVYKLVPGLQEGEFTWRNRQEIFDFTPLISLNAVRLQRVGKQLYHAEFRLFAGS